VLARSGLKKNRAVWIVATVAVAFLAIATALVNVPPLTDCGAEPLIAAEQHWFRAMQTMAQPWRGPHHVYGIFTIPEQYKFDHLYTAKLTIQGLPTEFQAGSPEDGDIYNGRPKPGYYAKRVYLSTRTALWFLLIGRFGDLRTSCHWWLVISNRVRDR
jgi:hypothetical protein